MPKAYIFLECSIHDPELYRQYVAQTPDIVARYGGRFIVRGGQTEVREGEAPAERVVISEFPSMEHARKFYESEDYQRVLPLRKKAMTGRLFFVEGSP